jgi:hypothetical protein
LIRRWLSLLVAQLLLRAIVTVLTLLAALLVAVAAAPATLVAAGGFVLAWRRGWSPRQLLVAAAWCLPMVIAWLAAAASDGAGWLGVALLPYHAWTGFWRLIEAGSVLRAAATVAPAAIPIGLVGGSLAWAYRVGSLRSGVGGRSPASAVTFDQRQWRHQARAARARIAVPDSVPIITRSGHLTVGAVIRSVGHRTRPIAAIGYERMRSHQVVVGTTGTGKTTLLLRLWAGFMAAGLRRQAAGLGDPPLLVVLDCKGGSDARRIADRTRRVLREAGVRSTAIWPDEANLNLWALPPRQLTTTLVDLIEHGTGSAAYYTDVMEALVGLAVEAPGGPPRSGQDFIGRLEPGWLSAAYAATGNTADHQLIRSASRHLADIALRFRTLLRRLGTGFDGDASFDDADAWYCILEGTDQISVAEGQARALVDLLASFAARGPARREILLAVDEFSAVSRRLPIWQLYERARSLGLAVQVSAQSWQGLGTEQDERNRIASTAEGGVWLLRTPQPEPVTSLAGTRKELETTRRLRRFPFWAHQGTSRLREVPVVDPALIRSLDVGQVAYLYRGGVTYIQIKRLVAAPAPVSQNPIRAAWASLAAADLAADSAEAASLAAASTAAPTKAAPRTAAHTTAAASTTAARTASSGPGGARPGQARLRPPDLGHCDASDPDVRLPDVRLPDVSAVLDAAFGPEPSR